MNLAAAAPEQTESTVSQTVPVVVLGTDALLAAAPYTAVQLAHACLQAGYANVVPASWGDELVAAAVIRRLPTFGPGPAIQCSCPIVAHRLLTTGGDLRPVMLPLVSPPVALARYLRAVSHPARMRITYVGGCPGAVDDSIDIRMSPGTLIGMLAERQIVLDDQPRVFESIIPPDRRRYFSQPGGVPSAERLWTDLGARALVDVESDDFVSEIADHLLAGEHVLMDVAPRLGCVCSGAIAGTPSREARASVVALEPPRSSAPVVEEQTPLNLDLPIPAVPRTPVDVVLGSSRTPSSPLGLPNPPGAHRNTPTVTEPRISRPPPPPPARPITGGVVPTARHADGKSLPRAYVARRRHSAPKGNPSVPPPASNEQAPGEATAPETADVAHAASIEMPPPAAMETSVAEPRVEATNVSTIEVPSTKAPTAEAPSVDVPTTEARIVEPSPDEASSVVAVTDAANENQLAATDEPESLAAAELYTDLNQLNFEGLAPPPPERLPIFTPTPASTIAVSTTPSDPTPSNPTPSNPTPTTAAPRGQSRITMYVIAVAIVILVVAGVAYVMGRSAQTPNAPSEQLP